MKSPSPVRNAGKDAPQARAAREVSPIRHVLERLARFLHLGSTPSPHHSRAGLVLRAIRPVILTSLAALGFAGLLRWHHLTFEKGLVENFQQAQLESVQGIAGAMEEMFADTAKNLQVLAGSPELSRCDIGAQALIETYYQAHSDVVSAIAVVDSDGRVLIGAGGSPPGLRHMPEFQTALDAGRTLTCSASSDDASGHLLGIIVPVIGKQHPAAALYATVSTEQISAKCLSRNDSLRRTPHWLFDSSGALIYGTQPPPRSAVITDSREQQSALGPYLMHKCAAGGIAGLAEMPDRDGNDLLLLSYAPVTLGDRRFGLAAGAPKAGISVPLSSHERVTYVLIIALAVLYFATGYVAHRSEAAQARLAQEQRTHAEQASRAKGEFLARMSHEIRTPLNGIMGMTDLAMGCNLDEEPRRYLGIAKTSADALLTVINDILDFSKIEAGKLTLNIVPFEFRDCLSGTVLPLEVCARGKNLPVSLRVADDVPDRLIGDPGRLRQIVTNLVGNAVKFTDQGHVAVSVRVISRAASTLNLLFSVRDTGPGIPADQQKLIFVAFQQAGRYQTSAHGGTGLGLAISRQLVELMGGRIWVASHVGKGSEFCFTASFEQQQKAAPSLDLAPSPLKDADVLVVGESMPQCQALARQLEELGAVVRLRPDMPSALDVLAESPAPTAVILSAGMMEDTVLDFADLMRQLPQCRQTALMVWYSAGLRGDACQCSLHGIDAYIVGPMNQAQLDEALLQALQRRRKGRHGLVTRHELESPPTVLRILLAEDNPVNQELTMTLLGKMGHHVDLAVDGRQAIQRFTHGPAYDIILMDIQMPIINGIDATREIRRIEGPRRNIPIVAMTAHALGEDRSLCLQAGMNAYISKPIKASELAEMLQRMANLSQQGPKDASAPPSPQGNADSISPAESQPRATAEESKHPQSPPAEEAPGDMAAADHQPSWNRDQALAFTGGDTESLRRIGQVFLSDSPELLSGVRGCAARGDADSLHRLTHRLQGSLRVFAAGPSVDACRALDTRAASGDWPAAMKELECLEDQVRRLYGCLGGLLKEDANARSSRG